MDTTTSLIKTFLGQLNQVLPNIHYPPTNDELEQLMTWIELHKETDESLNRRSKQRRSVRRRARDLARKVYDISPALFVLCAMSFRISNLPTIKSGKLYDHLDHWKDLAVPDALSKLTTHHCPSLKSRADNELYALKSHNFVHEPSKHQTLPSHALGIDSDMYLSFSHTRHEMIDNLPEPFRTGIKTSKQWKEEQMRGGLSVTNCLNLFLPEKMNEDTLLVIRMGYEAGFTISDTLGLGDEP